MGDNFQVLEILIFAVIAGILVFRLRSVLGRRTGHERRRDLPLAPRATPPQTVTPATATVALPSRPRPAAVATGETGDAALAALLAADPGFDRNAFLDGARGAFQIIVESFAAGDNAKLQPLLSREVFGSFSGAIVDRDRAQEKQDTRIVAIKSVELAQGRVEGDTELVTVKFVSDQILVTRDATGTVVDGDPDHAVEHTDLWTFSRAVRSPDPNWILIATDAPQHP
jgi:predicted lipid-binding transport protein (Tim44 family)